jgi:hypothetical protein
MTSDDGLVTTDAELLAIEAETLWTSDDRGRLLNDREANGRTAPHLVLGAGADGTRAIFLGSDVPENAAQLVERVVADSPPSTDAVEQPPALDNCRKVLEKVMGPVRLEVGVSYLIPADFTVGPTADLVLPGGNLPRSLRSPVDHWEAEEWQRLLGGDRGPWAMATANGRVISLCHSARLAERGAEAGTWTDPAFRGRGHAAAVTAAWGSQVAPSGRCLFYSTSAKNHSSQRVAERLQLRCLGLMWHLVAD